MGMIKSEVSYGRGEFSTHCMIQIVTQAVRHMSVLSKISHEGPDYCLRLSF